MINLACIRGNIGYWSYYSAVIKVKDLVADNRVITVSESTELYTKNINRILQREINHNRIKAIKEYITTNEERFFNSLIVAIHKGNPKWSDIDLYDKIEVDGNNLDESQISFFESKFGILTLYGDEEIFALDGQHRLKGLRKAYEEDNALAEKEIPVIFVIHNHEKVGKTRRLFTVLNKYAEKPKGAELIILDEDDVAAINSRKLVMEHPILSKPNALSNSKTANISKSDNTSFTTLVTINKVNKKLYSLPSSYYASRPSNQNIDELYRISKNFWDTLFEVFPELVQFINGESNLKINGTPILRNDPSGGSLLLRPVGQELIANAYTKFIDSDDIDEFKRKLRNIDFNLSSNNWKYIFWNGKMLGKEVKLKNDVMLFLLGKLTNAREIHREVTRVYGLHNQDYSVKIQPID